MPTTRRKRANPPEEPENSNQAAEQSQAEVPGAAEQPAQGAVVENEAQVVPEPVENVPTQPFSSSAQPVMPPQLPPSLAAAVNGERAERTERQEYFAQPTEGMRRTSFRRPQPQQVAQPVQPALPPQPILQPPSHEIKLPLGNKPGDTQGELLHLAYNPSYTGAEEIRSKLLHKLANESKSGGRARCWNCGSLAISYECWNSRSKAFGEIGVAFCEICGVWSVL